MKKLLTALILSFAFVGAVSAQHRHHGHHGYHGPRVVHHGWRCGREAAFLSSIRFFLPLSFLLTVAHLKAFRCTLDILVQLGFDGQECKPCP